MDQHTTPFKLNSLRTYPGGKGADGTVQKLINMIPPHKHYFELFLGGGAIMRHKRPAQGLNVGFDMSEQVLDAWAERPRWVHVVRQDALQWLETATIPANSFLFIDPPYLDQLLSNGRAPYEHRMSYDDHVRLLTALRKVKAPAMVCRLPCLLYENQLATWRTVQYWNKTRRGMQMEQVWMNYPAPQRLHDARYIGNTYRDRERIKGRIDVITKLLKHYTPLEQRAILERVTERL